jgi:hypothetical protein
MSTDDILGCRWIYLTSINPLDSPMALLAGCHAGASGFNVDFNIALSFVDVCYPGSSRDEASVCRSNKRYMLWVSQLPMLITIKSLYLYSKTNFWNWNMESIFLQPFSIAFNIWKRWIHQHSCHGQSGGRADSDIAVLVVDILLWCEMRASRETNTLVLFVRECGIVWYYPSCFVGGIVWYYPSCFVGGIVWYSVVLPKLFCRWYSGLDKAVMYCKMHLFCKICIQGVMYEY